MSQLSIAADEATTLSSRAPAPSAPEPPSTAAPVPPREGTTPESVNHVFRSFQLAAAYCLTCSEDSSERVYDPTRECFMAELADGAVEEASSDDGNRIEHPPANQVVAPPPAIQGAVPPPNPAASSSLASRQAQLAQLTKLEKKLEEEWRQTRLLRTTLEQECVVRVLRHWDASLGSGSWPTTTSANRWN